MKQLFKKYIISNFILLSFFLFFVSSIEAASQSSRKNDVTITKFLLKINGVETNENNAMRLWNWLDWDFEVSIDNSDKNFKSGDKIIKPFTFGQFFNNETVSFSNKEVDLVGTDGVTYGKLLIVSGTNSGGYKRGQIEITLNSNIEKVTKAESKVYMTRYSQYYNVKFDNVLYPFNLSIDGLSLNLVGKSDFLNEESNSSAYLSLEPVLNKININIYTWRDIFKAMGNEDIPIPTFENARFSWSMDGDYSNSYMSGVNGRIHRPVYSSPTDNRISTFSSRNFSLNAYMTKITQNPGETFADFRNRVWSKKYQWGEYRTSNQLAVAVNMGDYTKNGWRDGNPKVWEPEGFSGIQALANSMWGSNNGMKEVFMRIYGPQGRLNGGVGLTYINGNISFPNYQDNQSRRFTYSSRFYRNGNETETNSTTTHTTNILSTKYTINAVPGQVVVQVFDKDTGSLLPNVRIGISTDPNDEGYLMTNGVTNDGGLVSFENLQPRKYIINVNGIPTGYQNKVEFLDGNNNTPINSSGEFTLQSNGSAVIRVNLEKIKSQAVDFTVRDTASKVIVGESFNIYRNGARIVTYTTNSQGKFSVPSLPSGEYALLPDNPLRAGSRAFVVEEGKSTKLEVNAVLPVIPEITANGPSSINLGNVNIGQVTRSTIPLDVTYREDNGFVVTARQSSNTNIDFELNDTLITTQEKEFTNLNGTPNPVTTMINYQLNAKTTSNSTKGNKSTNIIFSFKYKL